MFIILEIFIATRAVLKIGGTFSDISQFQLGNIRPRDAFTLIAQARIFDGI